MTDAELRDAAWARFAQTTIGYQQYLDYKTHGYKGKPYAWQGTHWNQGKLLLDQIGETAAPVPAANATVVVNTPDALKVLKICTGGDLILRGQAVALPGLVLDRDYEGLRIWFEQGAHLVAGTQVEISGSNVTLYGLNAPGGYSVSVTPAVHGVFINGSVDGTAFSATV